MMKKLLADLYYLPNLEYFCSLLDVQELYLYPGSPYQRKSYFNRTQIRLTNKVETLSVPIVGRRPRLSQGAIQIDNHQKWQKVHLRGIQSAYGKSPFFEFIFPYFEACFQKNQDSLWALNLELLTICLKLLRLPISIKILSELPKNTEFEDFRGVLGMNDTFSSRTIYHPVAYQQNFGLDFEPNLSILDLLVAEGAGAIRILQASRKKH